MRYLNRLTIVGVFLTLAACKTGTVRADMPAYLVDPTPESRAELQRVVSDALNGRAVTIADDALTNDSLLIIEPKNLTGRDLGRPEHFMLVSSGSRCVLVHKGTEARYELRQTTCTTDIHR